MKIKITLFFAKKLKNFENFVDKVIKILYNYYERIKKVLTKKRRKIMNLETINKNIKRLIEWRKKADKQTQEKINTQLTKLYDFKFETLKGV